MPLIYDPAVKDNSAEYVARTGEIQGQMYARMGSDIGNALSGIAGAYTENKAMKARAESYDKIGEIIGSTMFQNNPQAQMAIEELKKEKDPQKRSLGWQALIDFAGPYSNWSMAQTRSQQATSQPYINAAAAQAKAAASGQAFVDPRQTFGNINFGAVE